MRKYILLICASFIGCGVGYGFVFGGNLSFSTEVAFGTTIGKEVILGSDDLSHTIVVYKSNVNISSYEVFSLCDTQSEFIASHKDLYFFRLTYKGEMCRSASIVLKNDDLIYGNTAKNITIHNKNNLLEYYLDYSTSDLEIEKNMLKSIVSNTAIYKNYKDQDFIKYLKYAIGKRKYAEAFFRHRLIQSIVSGRDLKYITPVEGRSLSTTATKIPNSPRPYRASYTDGIHHGWDIDGASGDTVIALDDGIIVRIVDGFDNATDFSKIVYGGALSYEQKLKNLDVLRGNQVWIKTLKGDVVFYSHLQNITPEMVEGSYVSRGDQVGTTGVTGVPEIGYDDYHLHFAIMKNPYNKMKAGTYDFGDYMAWDWYGKNMTYEQTLELQRNTFE